MVRQLDENGVVEWDDVTWGALVVQVEKPHQENVLWHYYKWRLCVSYQKLNQVTCLFAFPIPLWDDVLH